MKIALQLYSIKNISANAGLPAALDKAKELGYEGVEFAGLFGLTPEEAKAELDKRGLLCAGFHDGASDPAAAVAMARTCGAYSLCVPYFNADTSEKWIAYAKTLNETGKLFRENGILFGYHNHVHEFKPLADGGVPMDLLLENVDYENVFFEMDTRHVRCADVDPAAYAVKYAHYMPVIHFRDTDGDRDMAVGAGIVDFPAIIAKAGLPVWGVVENENFDENEGELAASVTYLKETFGGENA